MSKRLRRAGQQQAQPDHRGTDLSATAQSWKHRNPLNRAAHSVNGDV
jgi:hypothetical protein